ncbi:uncharacterized protein LOC117123560 isoform X2 [Anneissia japonica]|uniref:uncharacterized protein LOC117123560 isoform X2 n=1 Tax=Anneissia japonica TaxID=1529436 RepID=UPI0014258358|nr:uncharacterized protein LOC117123560 isoform X2 [Anneissia japonica]
MKQVTAQYLFRNLLEEGVILGRNNENDNDEPMDTPSDKEPTVKSMSPNSKVINWLAGQPRGKPKMDRNNFRHRDHAPLRGREARVLRQIHLNSPERVDTEAESPRRHSRKEMVPRRLFF